MLDVLEKLLLVRRVEEAIADRYDQQKMRCPTHLSIGQELPAVAVCDALDKNDLAVSTHRCHAHYIAKGGSLSAFIAELYGKATGCAKGRGGSMHLIDESVGFVGATAVVGNSIPVGTGLAMSIKLKGKQNSLAAIFIGEAAVETGAFFESVNFAATNCLPVMYVCENNLYSVYSNLEKRQPKGRQLFEMVRGMGVNSEFIDTKDALETMNKTRQVIEKAKENQAPLFLEFPTYRHREHCGPNFDDQLNYRDKRETEYWVSRDPLNNLYTATQRNSLHAKELAVIEKKIETLIKEAFDFAEKSPLPHEEDMIEYVT